MLARFLHKEMLYFKQFRRIHLLVEPQLDDLVAKHVHTLHLRCHIVLTVHRIDTARRAARSINRSRPVGGTSTGIQRVNLLHRPAAIVLVGIVVPSAAEVDA